MGEANRRGTREQRVAQAQLTVKLALAKSASLAQQAEARSAKAMTAPAEAKAPEPEALKDPASYPPPVLSSRPRTNRLIGTSMSRGLLAAAMLMSLNAAAVAQFPDVIPPPRPKGPKKRRDW